MPVAIKGYLPKILINESNEKPYTLNEEIVYRSKRYNKVLTMKKGFTSDGATFAVDIKSLSWWVHDHLCVFGKWDCGTRVTAFQASMVLRDILLDENRYVRAQYWFFFTFLFGCRVLRSRNGWIIPKH